MTSAPLCKTVVPDLRDPPRPLIRQAIAKWFWDKPSSDLTSEAYWAFYEAECQRALDDDGEHISVRFHQDIMDTVAVFKAGQSRETTRSVLRKKLKSLHDDEHELLDASIDLAARLLLMIDFGTIRHTFSGRHRLDWGEQGSLRDCVAAGLAISSPLDRKNVQFPRAFNAQSLVRIAGLELVPTTNLLDHLRLTTDDTKLHVFYQASFLKLQSASSLLPSAFVKETLHTLALLFPETDNSVHKWARNLSVPFSLDPELTQCGYLKTEDRQSEKFPFWHDRLIILRQVFDEATPQTLTQWWFDRRNGVQWYTFWVAVLVLGWTLVFGFVQSVASLMQVYAAFNPKIQHQVG